MSARARLLGTLGTVLAAVALVAAACSGSGQEGVSGAVPASVTTPESPGTVATTPGATVPATTRAAPPPARVAPGPAAVFKLPSSLSGTEWERIPTSRRVVALTFDACGNSAGASSILSTLAAKGVPATFFVCGRWAEAFPDETRTIASRYPVGNHTYSHPHLPALTEEEATAEIEKGARVLQETTQVDARPLFRFPYGDRNASTIALVNALGYGSVRWTVDTLGWEGASAGQSAASVRSRVLAALQPGEIVLMHVGGANDGTTLDADALPGVVDAVRSRGFRFVDVYRYAARYARVADDDSSRFSASSSWATSSWSAQRYGAGYHYASPQAVDDAARFSLRIPQTTRFRVYGWWPASASYNPAARIALETLSGRRVVVVGQRERGGRWVALGTYRFEAGDRPIVRVLRRSSATGRIVADAFRVTSPTPP
jgi:peptidoglycan-N-acetylglucosamine deacetylase